LEQALNDVKQINRLENFLTNKTQTMPQEIQKKITNLKFLKTED
jgi:hypothetical protein